MNGIDWLTPMRSQPVNFLHTYRVMKFGQTTKQLTVFKQERFNIFLNHSIQKLYLTLEFKIKPNIFSFQLTLLVLKTTEFIYKCYLST